MIRLTAAHGWYAIGLAVAAYELGTWWVGTETLSQVVWRLSAGREWVRWAGAVGLAALWWHWWGPES
jgi:hypothetical protein